MHKKYQCKLCNRLFARQQTLNSHMLIHMFIKPHKCQACGRRFTQKSHLVRHEQTHTDAKPFPCLSCEKCFSDKRNLVCHARRSHPEKSAELLEMVNMRRGNTQRFRKTRKPLESTTIPEISYHIQKATLKEYLDAASMKRRNNRVSSTNKIKQERPSTIPISEIKPPTPIFLGSVNSEWSPNSQEDYPRRTDSSSDAESQADDTCSTDSSSYVKPPTGDTCSTDSPSDTKSKSDGPCSTDHSSCTKSKCPWSTDSSSYTQPQADDPWSTNSSSYTNPQADHPWRTDSSIHDAMYKTSKAEPKNSEPRMSLLNRLDDRLPVTDGHSLSVTCGHPTHYVLVALSSPPVISPITHPRLIIPTPALPLEPNNNDILVYNPPREPLNATLLNLADKQHIQWEHIQPPNLSTSYQNIPNRQVINSILPIS
eukprot:265431_1